jgi:Zn-dependent protease
VNGSFKIGTAFGIPVRLHWSFLLLLALLVGSRLFPAVVILTGCVLLHELGHGLVARRFGIRVLDISFWPLGGMARMSAMPEEPRVEALVAIAGPAVNFALAGLALAVFLVMSLAGASVDAVALVGMFGGLNLTLGTFNLLPAFPMDGGRILRAWFARRTDWVSATERAVRAGRGVALGMLLISIPLSFALPQMFCALPLIALFVWIAGGRELLAVRLQHGHGLFGAAPGATAAPRRPEAYVHRSATDAEPERGVARKPAAWEPASTDGRLDDEQVRALERFRGRLRRFEGDRPPASGG